MSAELPLLLKEMQAATENLNMLVEHAAVLLYAAGTLGDNGRRQHTHSARRRDGQWEMTEAVHWERWDWHL